MNKPNLMTQYIEEEIVLIRGAKSEYQYQYVQGMLAAASVGSLITSSDKSRLQMAAKDALAGFACELDFYADAMARRAENDRAMFEVVVDPAYIAPPCPSLNLLQGRKANDLATLEYDHV